MLASQNLYNQFFLNEGIQLFQCSDCKTTWRVKNEYKTIKINDNLFKPRPGCNLESFKTFNTCSELNLLT